MILFSFLPMLGVVTLDLRRFVDFKYHSNHFNRKSSSLWVSFNELIGFRNIKLPPSKNKGKFTISLKTLLKCLDARRYPSQVIRLT